MSLAKPTLKDVILQQLEQEALNLIVAVRQGYTIKTIKEFCVKIGTLGDSLQ